MENDLKHALLDAVHAAHHKPFCRRSFGSVVQQTWLHCSYVELHPFLYFWVRCNITHSERSTINRFVTIYFEWVLPDILTELFGRTAPKNFINQKWASIYISSVQSVEAILKFVVLSEPTSTSLHDAAMQFEPVFMKFTVENWLKYLTVKVQWKLNILFKQLILCGKTNGGPFSALSFSQISSYSDLPHA